MGREPQLEVLVSDEVSSQDLGVFLQGSSRGTWGPAKVAFLSFGTPRRALAGVATLLVFYGIAGAGNGLENVACDTLIGSTVEPSKLGRVFGTVYGPIFLASTLAAVAGAALVSLASPRVAFLAAGCGVLFVLLLVRKMLPALPEEPRAA